MNMENIALGRPYTITPEPNPFPEGDRSAGIETALTDGVYSEGMFHWQPTTMGWNKPREPVEITIDLGEDQPICGLSYSTAAGDSGLTWPQTLSVFVSQDGEHWLFVGDVLRDQTHFPPVHEYCTYRFVTDGLRVHGRYVRLTIVSWPFTFCDEIEVYRGEDEWLSEPIKGYAVADTGEAAYENKRWSCAYWRMRADLQEMEERIQQARLPEAERGRLVTSARALRTEIEALPHHFPDQTLPTLPLNETHAKIYALNAPLLRADGVDALAVWHGNRWDPLTPTQGPRGEQKPELALQMMQNETRAEAINVTNASDEDAELNVIVYATSWKHPERNGWEPLPIVKRTPQWVKIYQVDFTDTHEHAPIATVLREPEKSGEAAMIAVPAGTTRQVWVSFEKPDLKPTEYRFQIELRAGVTVLVEFHLSESRMADRPALALGGWDCVEDRKGHAKELVRVLREHYMNAPWSYSAGPNNPRFTKDGRMLKAPSYQNWDCWVGLWKDCERYHAFLFWGSVEIDKQPASHEMIGSPLFFKITNAIFNHWAAHCKKQGIDPSQVHIFIMDEPHTPEEEERLIHWARAIHESECGFQVWQNAGVTSDEMFQHCDTLVVGLQYLSEADSNARYLESGRPLHIYNTRGPAKLGDPVFYQRAQAWWALQYGATGIHFWRVGPHGNTSGGPYSERQMDYSAFFVMKDEGVVVCKHLEAIREGVEDYEYMRMLEECVRANPAADPEWIEAAQALLDTLPLQITREVRYQMLWDWQRPKARHIFDDARLRVLDMIEELEEKR